MFAEQILLVRCRHRLDVDTENFERRLAVHRKREVAEQYMPGESSRRGLIPQLDVCGAPKPVQEITHAEDLRNQAYCRLRRRPSTQCCVPKASGTHRYQRPASHMQHQEHAFCQAMDAAAEYINLQEQLGATLRKGHLQLARARYAMGPGSVGSANYSSTMQATSQVHVSSADLNPFQVTERPHTFKPPNSLGSVRNDSHEKAVDSSVPSTSKANEAQDSTSTMQPEANADASTASQSSHSRELDVTNQYSSDAISELAAKFGTKHVDRPSPVSENAVPKDPLKWFGFMVSPHLKQSQADFKEAVTLLIDLANAQHRIHVALNVLTHCQDAHVDVAVGSSDEQQRF